MPKCFGVGATLAHPFDPTTPCDLGTSTLLMLPQTGQENDDHFPNRVKARSLFDIAVGMENLFHTEGKKRIVASVQVMNLTNKVARYNFFSSFSGTHFVPPRRVVGRFGFTF